MVSTERYYGAKRVRRSLIHFLLGRGMTAVVSFAVALILIQNLSITEYAGYTALSGFLVFMTVISSGGLDRVVPRYFPELRQVDAYSELRKFCWQLIFLRFLFLTLIILFFLVVYSSIYSWFGLPGESSMMWAFAAYVCAYGMNMHIAKSLQALLHQKEATQGMAIEWFMKLGILVVWVVLDGSINLPGVIWIQAFTVLVAAVFMLYRLNNEISCVDSNENKLLNYSNVVNMGVQNYLQSLTGIHAGPAVSKMVSAFFLPELATAMFGFSHALTGVVRRYMPANLLIGLIEPTVMARYSENRDFSQTMHMVSIVLKVNFFVLIPFVAWIVMSGESVLAWVSNDKYSDAVWVVAILLIVLMIESHRIILQMIVNAIEYSELLVYSNLWSLLFVPVAIGLIMAFGLNGLLGSVLIIGLFRNYYLIQRLRDKSFQYQLDWLGIAKIFMLSLVATITAEQLSGMVLQGVNASLLSGVVAVLIYLTGAYFLKPFNTLERSTINRFIGRKLFIW